MNGTPMPALDADRIRSALQDPAEALLRHLTVLPETDSTNSAVNRLPSELQHGHAILAERQTRGRGRRQRRWHSPPGGNLYLSLGWRFDSATQPLAVLPLVVAVCLSRALEAAGLDSHGIKWPNDILVGGRKLAGVLVELRSAGSGPALAVAGVGLNVVMPGNEEANERIDQPWTDLATELEEKPERLDRNPLAATVLDRMLNGFATFGETGFASFEPDWRGRDLLRGRPVQLRIGRDRVAGTARGISDDGGLLIESANGDLRAFHSGEASVRHA
ncbi:MAG: biotin--[acetyl-CoA-carboxylase] ligase [Xanthomonadales bacterium]|nr:biotin--[acetyl-CoA-carboxylase] ligase [Gammaproteobacteria bacterium]NNJ65216.1 biotin--[acetyl-CoA-carboxylase] ligase [Xanthomonadales bacterium]